MVDSHCHLADAAFDDDREAVIERARMAGVGRALCILAASDGEEAGRMAEVLERWPDVRLATGIHPHTAGSFAGDPAAAARATAEVLDAQPGARAVGEIGLDYHYDFAPRDVQQAVFSAQIALALDRDLPVVIHTREAEDDTFAILEREGRGRLAGVFHCFTGGPAMARRAVDLGFHVSFAGILTFPKAGALRDAAAEVPDDRLLVETDAPYLAPVPHRGHRNEPAWIARTIDVLAEVRQTTAERIATLTTRNFERLFRP